MAKKKKTRKQKIAADVRHENYVYQTQFKSQDTISMQSDTPHTENQIKQISKPQISTLQYSYLYTDLRKTILLTISIICIELIFKYFLFGAH
jgi:hypothetical protein